MDQRFLGEFPLVRKAQNADLTSVHHIHLPFAHYVEGTRLSHVIA